MVSNRWVKWVALAAVLSAGCSDGDAPVVDPDAGFFEDNVGSVEDTGSGEEDAPATDVPVSPTDVPAVDVPVSPTDVPVESDVPVDVGAPVDLGVTPDVPATPDTGAPMDVPSSIDVPVIPVDAPRLDVVSPMDLPRVDTGAAMDVPVDTGRRDTGTTCGAPGQACCGLRTCKAGAGHLRGREHLPGLRRRGPALLPAHDPRLRRFAALRP